MARRRKDGAPSREPSRHKLTDPFVKGKREPGMVWDLSCPGLGLSVRRTGKRSWKVVYRRHGRPVWYHLGDALVIGLADARKKARKILLEVSDGKDPAAERKAERMSGTFAELARDYVELHAKKHNKSWPQAEKLVTRHLLPRWAKLKVSAITRAEVKNVMVRIEAPIAANQVLASASAIFSWAVKQDIVTVNPCKLVDRNPTTSRERVLSDDEIKMLWPRLDTGLKLILLTGQRPGEVAAMERQHVAETFWQLPGKPKGDWPGTKNGRDHRVALSDSALALVEEHLAVRPTAKVSGSRMSKLVAELELERATPHDLRRTCLTIITRLGFGRDAMDRVANHRTSSVTDVYDRHGYADEDKRIMAAVARLISTLVEGKEESNVVSLR